MINVAKDTRRVLELQFEYDLRQTEFVLPCHMMARTGRPPKAGKTMKRQFAVRVTPDEEREIQEMAAKAGMSVSDWMRASILAMKLLSRNPESFALTLYPEDETELRRIVSPELAAARRSNKHRTTRTAPA